MYKIIDSQTGEIVATRSNSKTAYHYATKLDLKFGASRYYVQQPLPC